MVNKPNILAVLGHPFVVVLAVIVIAYAGYLCGHWLRG
jgi:hypothetical protein